MPAVMHDLRSIRENPEAFDAGLARRGAEPASARILEIDERRRAVTTRVQEAQARRNEASRAIGAPTGCAEQARAPSSGGGCWLNRKVLRWSRRLSALPSPKPRVAHEPPH